MQKLRINKLGLLALVLGLTGVFSLCQSEQVSAATLSCSQYYNQSQMNACNLSSGTNRGALWINAVKSGSGVEYDNNISVKSEGGYIQLYLHGAVYNSSGLSSVGNAVCIRIYSQSVSEGTYNCNQAPASMSGVTLGGSTLGRGYAVSWSNWSVGWENYSVSMRVRETVFTENGTYNASDNTYSYTFHVYRCYEGQRSVSSACYSDPVTVKLQIDNSYYTNWSSQTNGVLTVGNSEAVNVTSDWASGGNSTTVSGSYEITSSILETSKITWQHTLRRTDSSSELSEHPVAETAYQILRNSVLQYGWATVRLNGNTQYSDNNMTRSVSVSSLGLESGTKNMSVCENIYHHARTYMTNADSSYQSTGLYSSSEACILLSRPFEVTVTSVSNNVSNLYIGESGDYNYTVSVSGAPSEQVDLDGDGDLEDPPTPTYRVFGLWVDTDGNDSDGDFLSGGTDRKAISGSASCSTIGATTSFVRSCEVLKEGSYASGTISGSGSIATPDEEAYVGAKYCVVVARNYFSADGDTFTGYEEGGDSWGVETISCGATYKKPNLRITGASAYASGSIVSTIVNKTTSGYDSTSVKFGSWSEYLLVSGSTISNFASGAYYSIGNTSNSASSFSPMTIANTDTNSLGSSGIDTGSTTFIKKLDAYLAKLDSLASSSSTATFSDSQGGVSFTCNSSRGVCYSNSSGDVTISSNINSITDRPIYIIRTSGSVYINSNVSYIDAWIIADGGVYTCSDVSSITNLSQNTCNQALTINGPVYASNLTAYRTAGANGVTSTQSSARTSDAESAETIHFPIKTYVWAYEESVTSDVRIYEASSTELAPRV